jgi:hypothetical protein
MLRREGKSEGAIFARADSIENVAECSTRYRQRNDNAMTNRNYFCRTPGAPGV